MIREPIPALVPHVYVHFPFCARKCPYCDFNSHARRERETDPYIDALLAEARAYAGTTRPRTIFVGGGTPTHCDAAQLERYLDGLREILGDDELVEFTVEANPGSVDAEKVAAMRRAGVNRVSMGAQSFNDRHLHALGRIHGSDETRRSAEILRSGGIERISMDLILAIPEQTLEEQEEDLESVVALEPEHVSAYVLTFEQGTVFTRAMEAGRLPAPVDERDLAHLHLACEHLAAAGYERYEISNFARAGAESLHNLAYWSNADWLGLGAGAHSHAAGRRWKNIDDPAAYAQAVASEEGSPIEWREAVAPAVSLLESLMMGLRLMRGVDLDELSRHHGVDLRVTHPEALAMHAAAGMIERDGPRLWLTPTGLDVANSVIADYLPEEDAPAEIEPDGSEAGPGSRAAGGD